MLRGLGAVIVSVLMLVPAWLGATGATLVAALVPLLWLSAESEDSRRGWWRMFGWALLTFAGWNAATVWWIWNATPVGPIAATLFSTFYNMLAFMAFHTVSKKAPKALAYTLLVALWITTEYWYTTTELSWPWLMLGNGFSHDVWAVQWYEWTGIFGGSAWVLLCNILIFEARREPRHTGKIIAAAAIVVVPIVISLFIGIGRESLEDGAEKVKVAIIQPNVDCYEKFNGKHGFQERNIAELLSEVPSDADFILLPETAVPTYYCEPDLTKLWNDTEPAPIWHELRDSLRRRNPQAMLITGANTLVNYGRGPHPRTARFDGVGHYDHFNSAVGLDSAGRTQIHHKAKLVIGVENTPGFVFDLLDFLVIDLGGIVGQIGMGDKATVFAHNGVKAGPAICYEGLYGDFFAGFARRGADFMAIISNDGWWGDTPGYRHLFTISRLRAIETRRAIARSANTGMSGFISPTGGVGETLGWEERGVISAEVPLVKTTTIYTRYGDYVARIAQLLTMLSALYYVAYRIRRRNHLV